MKDEDAGTELDAKEFADLFDKVVATVDGFLSGGALDLSNIDEVIKETMEAVELYGRAQQWSGTKKANIAKAIVLHVIDTIEARGKIDARTGDNLKVAATLMLPVIFKLVVLAADGKIAVAKLIDEAKAKCCPGGKCCLVS